MVPMRSLPTPIAMLSIVLALCRFAYAQPLFDDLPTLEWRTAQADLVITARILGFEVELGQHGVSRLGLTLETVETIKGNAAPVVEVSIGRPGVLDTVAEGLARRCDTGTIDVWFLTTRPETATFGGIGHGLHASMLPLTDWPTTRSVPTLRTGQATSASLHHEEDRPGRARPVGRPDPRGPV